jgi:tetratricopeptide (TPR) repeat protein
MEAVHHYEGMVNQVMGDGIMALFGAPVAHEDHAVRACYAALRMQRWINLYAEDLQRGGGTPVQIRVGLNSGEVVVRAIGSDLHMDYSAIGQTTRLAARMEQMAKPGSVLVTGDTLKLAEGYVRERRVGPVTVKGLENPTEVYELIGVGPTYYTQVRIDPFSPAGAEELLTALLGQDATLEPLKRVLIERTEGNPFFLEQSVQTLVETQVLVGDRGAYRITKAPPQAEGRPDAWQIPATVQAILAARIDRLPPEDKPLLQAASVIGKDVPFALLRAIADVPEHSLRRGLTQLQAAEFLYERSLYRDLEYTFKHALTHEVTYASVLQDRRRALHARIVEAIEALYPDRLAEQVERLAHHAFRGEVWEKAVTYLRQAGAKALARSAYREAVTGFEEALAALHPLPDTRQKIERAIDLRLDLRQALFPLNELATVWRSLEEAEGLARTLDDPRRLGWVSAYMSGHHLHTGGHVTEVRTLAERVDAIAKRLSDVPLQIAAQYYLAAASYLSGEYRATEHVCRTLMQSLHDQRTREGFGLATFPAVYSRAVLARALAERGVFDEGDAHGHEAIRIAEGLDHPFSVVIGCLDSRI